MSALMQPQLQVKIPARASKQLLFFCCSKYKPNLLKACLISPFPINEYVKVVFALERQQENGATVNLASLQQKQWFSYQHFCYPTNIQLSNGYGAHEISTPRQGQLLLFYYVFEENTGATSRRLPFCYIARKGSAYFTCLSYTNEQNGTK